MYDLSNQNNGNRYFLNAGAYYLFISELFGDDNFHLKAIFDAVFEFQNLPWIYQSDTLTIVSALELSKLLN